MTSTGLVVAVTAAGASVRMGSPKALLDWEGATFLESMISSLQTAGLPRPVVVLGADREAILRETRLLEVEALTNERHAEGRGTSIVLAAQHARSRDSALMLWPVDCPAVRPETLRALAEAAQHEPERNVVPRFGDRGGHPVVLAAAGVRAAADAGAELNLRDIMWDRRRGVVVDDPAVLDNVNTRDDYDTFLQERRRKVASTHG